LLVGLCRCEIWSLTLREEQRLRVFENRAGESKGTVYRCNGEDNIKMDLKGTGCEDVDWIHDSV